MFSNGDLERIIVGGVMQEPWRYPQISATLGAGVKQMHSPYREVMLKAEEFISEDTPLSPITLADAIGGGVELEDTLQRIDEHAVPHLAEWAARQLQPRLKREGFRQALQTATVSLHDNEVEVESVLKQIHESYFEETRAGDHIVFPGDLVKRVNEERRTRSHGMSTGFSKLDEKVNGVRPGDLWIIGGRTSMGKTALTMGIAFNMIRAGRGVLCFHCEGSIHSVISREVSRHTGFDSVKVMRGYLNATTMAEVQDKERDLAELKHWHVMRTRTVEQVTSISRSMADAYDINVVVIDYIQRLTTSRWAKLSGFEQIAKMSSELKSLAEDLNVGVLCVGQINRAGETEGQRPHMRHLRGSGDLEQDADVVLLLYRPGYYDEERHDDPAAEVNIAKNRDGDTGILEGEFQRHCVRWVL